MDGAQTAAQFNYPTGLCLATERGADSNSLLCADQNNHRIRRVYFSTGKTTTFAGTGEAKIMHGTCSAAAFVFPMSVCADPTKSGCYFISDYGSIRYCDGKSVSLMRVVKHTGKWTVQAVRQNSITSEDYYVPAMRKLYTYRITGILGCVWWI